MIAILSLLVLLGVSLVLMRVASVALVHTGMSQDAARFQARSAFTGAGFTTSESETVVSHPVRRRIVMWLMLVGNVGFVTVLSSLLLSLIDLRSSEQANTGIAVLGGGLLVLIWLSRSAWVDRKLCSFISWALRRYTDLDARDYSRLLHLKDGYGVTELLVFEDDWIAGRQVLESRLDLEGVRILGIECPGGHFLGAPDADVVIRPGDRLMLYGRGARIAELDDRCVGSEGETSHRDAVEEQKQTGEMERDSAGR
jgi:hypothetical protein